MLAWVLFSVIFKDKSVDPRYDPLIVPESYIAGAAPERNPLPYLYSTPALNSITANPAGAQAQRFVLFSVTLGLVGRDHGHQPSRDITERLDRDTAVLARIGQYDSLIKSTIVRIVRLKTVEQLDGENIHEVEEEIKKQLNRDIFQKLFPLDDKNKKQVQVQDVIFSDIIIQ